MDLRPMTPAELILALLSAAVLAFLFLKFVV